MKKYYEVLGLNEDATLEEVNDAFTKLTAELYNSRKAEEISRAEYARRYDELDIAREAIIDNAKAKAAEAAEAALVTDVSKGVEKEAEKIAADAKKEEEHKVPVEEDEYDLDDDYVQDAGAKSSGKGWKVATGVLAAALVATIAFVGLKGCSKQTEDTGAYVTGRPAITETVNDTPEKDQEVVVQETPSAAEETTEKATEKATETTTEETATVQETEEAVQEDYSNEQYIVDLGNVEDDTLVRARAQELADQMNAAGIVDPITTAPYTVDQIFALIKYANGVYTPETMEEIDVLHLNLLNLMISPLNTDDYLYHVVFANGNDDFNSLLNPNPNHVTFGEAFAAYGENGVYPLVQWFEQKRMEIYSSTDREEVNRIYREVGQVMADLMKGNGCTITLYDGKEAKEGIEYHFTSEQVLAHHSSAMIITTEFQLIMANHYEIRDVNDQVIDEVSQTWEVYNKLNSDGVDANGQPIINPDIVTYDEMNAWVNNGCDYEWAIDSVLIDGQTFGQRIQGDMEGMAQNNYAMQHGGNTLSK